MKSVVKFMLKSIVITCLVILVCYMLLVLSCMIPTKYIEDNINSSKDYFNTHLDTAESADNYLDNEVMSIAYTADTTNIIELEYKDYAFNKYWNGNLILVRPLLILFDIHGIRLILGITGIIVNIIVILILYLKQYKIESLCYLIGFISIHPYKILFCTEYVYNFIIFGVVCLLILKCKKENVYNLFIISGCLTMFFSVIATEILTYAIPMFVLLGMNKEIKDKFFIVKTSISWLLGYSLTYLIKLLVSDTVKIKNITNKNIISIFVKNIECIYPLNLMEILFIFIAFIVCIVMLIKYYEFPKLHAFNYLYLCLIPFVRYSVLQKQSYILSFATFRVLFITVVVVLYVVLNLIFQMQKFKK